MRNARPCVLWGGRKVDPGKEEGDDDYESSQYRKDFGRSCAELPRSPDQRARNQYSGREERMHPAHYLGVVHGFVDRSGPVDEDVVRPGGRAHHREHDQKGRNTAGKNEQRDGRCKRERSGKKRFGPQAVGHFPREQHSSDGAECDEQQRPAQCCVACPHLFLNVGKERAPATPKHSEDAKGGP